MPVSLSSYLVSRTDPVLAWAALVAAFLVILAVLVFYLQTLSWTALFAGLLAGVLSAVAALSLPAWAALSIVAALIAVVMIGGEALLLKTLVFGGVVLLVRWLWRRYVAPVSPGNG
jgi:hypothetical protein